MSSNFAEMQTGITIKECSMCGDLGIEKELFQCQRCLYRLQHRYCSKLYAHGKLNELICDWCLHERETSCNRDRNTRQIRNAQYISREKPSDEKPSPDNKRGKGESSTDNVECLNERPAAPISTNNENPPQHSSQRKGIVGGKEKIIKQRYRYKSLAQILSIALRI